MREGRDGERGGKKGRKGREKKSLIIKFIFFNVVGFIRIDVSKFRFTLKYEIVIILLFWGNGGFVFEG